MILAENFQQEIDRAAARMVKALDYRDRHNAAHDAGHEFGGERSRWTLCERCPR